MGDIAFAVLRSLLLCTIAGVNGEPSACDPGFVCVDKCPEVEAFHDRLLAPNTTSSERQELLNQIRQRRCQTEGVFGSKFCCEEEKSALKVAEVCGRPKPEVGLRVAGPINEDTSNPLGTWPWMTSYGRRRSEDASWEHLCGGTLITARHILTAAHCHDGNLYRARVGDVDLSDDADDFRAFESDVARFSPHPRYSRPAAYFDVAVMTMAEPVPSFDDFIVPVCLPTEVEDTNLDRDDGKLVSLTGWGLRRRNDFEPPGESLRRAHLGIFSQRYCNSTHGILSQSRLGQVIRRFVPRLFRPEVMCAGYELGGVGSCPGDSGGPLVRFIDNSASPHYEQISIVSGGVGRCGDRDFPGIYSRVAARAVMNFIKIEIKMDDNELIPTSPPGQDTCEFRGTRFFHSPRVPFLREDGKICICDDSNWIKLNATLKPDSGVGVNDVVDLDTDVEIIETDDNDEEEGEEESDGEIDPNTEVEILGSDDDNGDDDDGEEEQGEEENEFEDGEVDPNTEVEILTDIPAPLRIPGRMPCPLNGDWREHSPWKPIKINEGERCSCDNGDWVRCEPIKRRCDYQGLVYPHDPNAPVVGPTHVCYCNDGEWERCKEHAQPLNY